MRRDSLLVTLVLIWSHRLTVRTPGFHPGNLGENCQWQFARRLSDAGYDRNREIAGSRNVTDSLAETNQTVYNLSYGPIV